jgi:multidrug efflux pump subunit AcrB
VIGLIRFALRKPRATTVLMLAIVVIGILCVTQIPVDILPVYDRPAVQVLTFYSGMPPASIASAITNPMERWTGVASGQRKQDSRSILGVSVIHNFFHSGVDPNGALTQVNSLALAEIPNLPPGTLPPIVLPYDPTATVPACLVTLDSDTQSESTLYDVARYEVRNMIMSTPGAESLVVFGGKLRAILAYLDRTKMQSRGLSPMDVLHAIENYNVFLPTGDAKFGTIDFAIDSNSMFSLVDKMREIPLRREPGSADFLGDVADTKDSYLIQMNAVRVNGRREVYIPVYRQRGASTLSVVDDLKAKLPTMAPKLTRPDIKLKLVMDQSIYVRQSIKSLAVEGLLGAGLCSLVILIFLGEIRMTAIAVLMIPGAILAAIICLYYTGETLNVMTLAGIALAIGPLVDVAIVVLENTHRHLNSDREPIKAALLGASEVVLPEFVATCSTLLVLAPLAVMPSSGQFLFKPMALAVTFAMLAAMLLAMSFVPARCAGWLRAPNEDDKADGEDKPATKMGRLQRLFARWEKLIDRAIHWYRRQLDRVVRHRLLVLLTPVVLLVVLVVGLGPILRREFFPTVDAGAFNVYVRAASGTRLEATEAQIAKVEDFFKREIGKDLDLIISNIGVEANWSAAYTPNGGPMDAVVKVQLKAERNHSSQDYVARLRRGLAEDKRFVGLEFAFDAGGMVSTALNEGRTTPINIQITGKEIHKAHELAENIRREVEKVDGVVDARVMQRLDYPEYVIEIDRAKAREIGFTQEEIMKNVISAIKSSIQFNKNNFWFDPVSKNQYYVGVQYPEASIESLKTLLNVPITSDFQSQPIPLSNVATIRPTTISAEVTHTDLQSTIDVTMGIQGRDLGHVADEISKKLIQFGKPDKAGGWEPYDPDDPSGKKTLEGSHMVISGEYSHMQDTFREFVIGLVLAFTLIYFLMVSLLDSYIVPLVVLGSVPAGLIGVIPVLYLTGTAINVQSLLGVVFVVGIVVANTVLLTDLAQKLRASEQLSPTEAVCKAAELRARPVVMTALAALFALIPMALALERGSEANAPLGRAVIGGLVAGLATTLIIVPALYSLAVRGKLPRESEVDKVIAEAQ